MIEILRHTGEMETYTVDVKDEDGTVTEKELEREILEVVQTADTTEENRAQKIHAAKQRAALLTRDTDYKYSVREI